MSCWSDLLTPHSTAVSAATQPAATYAQHRYTDSITSPAITPSSNELLRQLNWLPIKWRIRFKLASLIFKALHTGHPPYIAELLQYHKPTKSTHSIFIFQFHGTTFHLVLVLFVSLHQKYGIPYRLTFCSLKHSLHLDVTWRPTTFSQLILLPSTHLQCTLIHFWDFGAI